MTQRQQVRTVQERLAAATALAPRYFSGRDAAALARTQLFGGTPTVTRPVAYGETQSRRAVAERVTELALRDFAELTHDATIQEKLRAGVKPTLGDVMRTPLDAVDTLALNPLSTGQPIAAALCNSVFFSHVTGSRARRPCDRKLEEQPPAVSALGAQQALYGWMSFSLVADAEPQVTIAFRAPFHGVHTFQPRKCSLRQVASMSNRVGAFLMCWTLRLISELMGLPQPLVAVSRNCWNCVYTAYMSCYTPSIDLDRFNAYNAAVVQDRRVFDGSVIIDPDTPKLRTLVFRTGSLIIVGANNPAVAQLALNKTIPLIHASRNETVVRSQ